MTRNGRNVLMLSAAQLTKSKDLMLESHAFYSSLELIVLIHLILLSVTTKEYCTLLQENFSIPELH